MTIKAGSPEAHARALKAAATRKRNQREHAREQRLDPKQHPSLSRMSLAALQEEAEHISRMIDHGLLRESGTLGKRREKIYAEIEKRKGAKPATRKPKPAPTTSRTQKRVSDIQLVDMADYRAGERAAEKWSRTKSPREIRRKIDDRLIRLAEDGAGDHSPQYWQGYLSALHDDARTKRERRYR